MECSVCYRQYCLSPARVLPKVGICGHSICHQCCEQLPNEKNCPYCQHSRSFEWQSRCFLAEDYLTMIENTDLIGKLLPELKQLIQDLEEKKMELKNDSKRRPFGLFSWLKRENKKKKAISQKLDCLIDCTTAIFRPKLMVPTRRKPFGHLYLEARNLQDLLVDQWIYGPPTEIAGCIWKIYVCKRKEEDEFYFCVGIDMETDKNSTKKFNGFGYIDIISQRHNVKHRRYRINWVFKAPISCQESRRLWKWENTLNDGFALNDRIFIECHQWNVKEIVENST